MKADVIEVCEYFVDHESTIRDTARVFHISKSTVYNYLTKYLPQTSMALYRRACKVIAGNVAMRASHGGFARALVATRFIRFSGQCETCEHANCDHVCTDCTHRRKPDMRCACIMTSPPTEKTCRYYKGVCNESNNS